MGIILCFIDVSTYAVNMYFYMVVCILWKIYAQGAYECQRHNKPVIISSLILDLILHDFNNTTTEAKHNLECNSSLFDTSSLQFTYFHWCSKYT